MKIYKALFYALLLVVITATIFVYREFERIKLENTDAKMRVIGSLVAVDISLDKYNSLDNTRKLIHDLLEIHMKWIDNPEYGDIPKEDMFTITEAKQQALDQMKKYKITPRNHTGTDTLSDPSDNNPLDPEGK